MTLKRALVTYPVLLMSLKTKRKMYAQNVIPLVLLVEDQLN